MVKKFDWQKLSVFDWVLVALMVIGGGLILMGFLGNMKEKNGEVEYLASGDDASEMVWVDVSGAVEKPGVYELGKGSRIKDALAAAGGLSETAEREYLEKIINMAEEVEDGQKIYIPSGGSGMIDESSGLININSASTSELDTLWGVGSARAEAIVDGRPFSKVEELLSKGVLPENVYEKIKDKVSVY